MRIWTCRHRAHARTLTPARTPDFLECLMSLWSFFALLFICPAYAFPAVRGGYNLPFGLLPLNLQCLCYGGRYLLILTNAAHERPYGACGIAGHLRYVRVSQTADFLLLGYLASEQLVYVAHLLCVLSEKTLTIRGESCIVKAPTVTIRSYSFFGKIFPLGLGFVFPCSLAPLLPFPSINVYSRYLTSKIRVCQSHLR